MWQNDDVKKTQGGTNTIRFEKEDLEAVVELLKEGNVVAFPTDTVYGLGVIYENEEALEALKEAKGRPENKPIPTMVASLEQIETIAEVDDRARKLVNAFMPGAFTIILKKKDTLPDYITNGFDTVGIRMPDDPFVLEMIEKCEKPLLVTSANLSGEETGVNDEQVLSQLDGRIDAIVLGEAGGKVASTIVDMSKEEINIIRSGPIDEETILNTLKQRKKFMEIWKKDHEFCFFAIYLRQISNFLRFVDITPTSH